jgi:hypothetical protein
MSESQLGIVAPPELQTVIRAMEMSFSILEVQQGIVAGSGLKKKNPVGLDS